MNRERALKVVLGLLGLLFSAGVYPLMVFVNQDTKTSSPYPLKWTEIRTRLPALRGSRETPSGRCCRCIRGI
jgi:hypothetical protein